jgi:hypothetical protein
MPGNLDRGSKRNRRAFRGNTKSYEDAAAVMLLGGPVAAQVTVCVDTQKCLRAHTPVLPPMQIAEPWVSSRTLMRLA